MNTSELKVGDRVRLTASNRLRGYRPGDKGVVDALPFSRVVARFYYAVRMDRDGPRGKALMFAADEIEPEV
jgi:hypothetical protein